MTDGIDHTSIKLTRAVRSLFSFTADCYREEFGDDATHKRAFVRRIAEHYAKLIGCKVVDPAELKGEIEKTYRGPEKRPIAIVTESPSFREAANLAEQIIDLADSSDLPAAGVDYAESVAAKARDIMESVEDRNAAAPNQLEALRNMLAGLERWFEHSERD